MELSIALGTHCVRARQEGGERERGGGHEWKQHDKSIHFCVFDCNPSDGSSNNDDKMPNHLQEKKMETIRRLTQKQMREHTSLAIGWER